MPTLNEIRSVLRADRVDHIKLLALAENIRSQTFTEPSEVVEWINKMLKYSFIQIELCAEYDRFGIRDDGYYTIDEKWICDEAYSAEYFTCCACCETQKNVYANRYKADSDYVCDSCRDNYQWSDRSRSYWPNGETPEEEDEDEDSDSDAPNMPSCIPRSSKNLIRAYSANVLDHVKRSFCYTPDEKLPLNPLWLGVELEVEGRERQKDYVRITHDAVNSFAIMKHDGSIANSGFEIVTVPATLAYHRKVWTPFFKDAAPMLCSWNTEERCGMHVHLSRAAISDLTLGHMLVFVNERKNEEFVTRVAGRSSTGYANREPKKVTDVKRAREIHGDALAFTSRNQGKTCELRIFRGNVSKGGFMKNLDFAASLVDFCKVAGTRQLTSAHFLIWLNQPENRRAYPYLTKWASRGGMIETLDRTVPQRFQKTEAISFEMA